MRKGVSLKKAQAAKQHAALVFAPLVGEQVAVGITRLDDDGFALKVNLTSEPPPGITLPGDVDGVPVQVDVVGRVCKR